MCDCLVALGPATESGRTLFAKNSDRPPNEAQAIEWLPPRRDEGPLHATHIAVAPSRSDTIGALVSRPTWMWGVEHGVNAAGVAIGNATIYTTLDPRRVPAALTGMDLVRLGLERATDAPGAMQVIIDLLERYGQGGSGYVDRNHPYWSSFLIADRDEAWVLETSGRAWASEQVGRTRATSNRTTIFEFDAAHRHPNQPVETLVDPRLDASRATLTAEPIGVADLKTHLRSHVGEEGYSVCMHAGDEQATTASMVAELGSSSIAHVALGYPCRSVYVPAFVGRDIGTPLRWQRFVGARPSHRRALDDLERELVADARDDDDLDDTIKRRVEQTLDEMIRR